MRVWTKNEENFEKFQENFDNLWSKSQWKIAFFTFFTKYFFDFWLLSESIYLCKKTADLSNNFSDFGGGGIPAFPLSRRYSKRNFPILKTKRHAQNCWWKLHYERIRTRRESEHLIWFLLKKLIHTYAKLTCMISMPIVFLIFWAIHFPNFTNIEVYWKKLICLSIMRPICRESAANSLKTLLAYSCSIEVPTQEQLAESRKKGILVFCFVKVA